MLTRRHIRIKVLHGLYAVQAQPDMDFAIALKNLNKSLSDIYELFLWDLGALMRLRHEAVKTVDNAKDNINRAQEFAAAQPLANHPFFTAIDAHPKLQTLLDESGANWSEYSAHFTKLWNTLHSSEEYLNYMALEAPEHGDHKRLLKWMYGTFINENEFLHELFEDAHAHWSDDLDAAQMMTAKLISSWKEGEELNVPNLYKDSSDEEFGPLLMRKALQHKEEAQELIVMMSKNWDEDRIARMDALIMRICVAEIMAFPEIPVKVSMNEYLELVKQYSTPKSSSFINGIIDKIVVKLQDDGRLEKFGRGLL